MKKKIFITGASSGIGEYLAYAYAKYSPIPLLAPEINTFFIYNEYTYHFPFSINNRF